MLGHSCRLTDESVLAGWSATLVSERVALGAPAAALGTSAFWVLLSLGRLIGVVSLRRGSHPAELATRCLASAATLLTAAAVLAWTSPPFSLVATGLALIACGPCYALIVSAGLNHASPVATTQVSTLMVAAGALGGASLAGLVSLSGAGVTLGPAVAACGAYWALARIGATPR
jgi:fucose permease